MSRAALRALAAVASAGAALAAVPAGAHLLLTDTSLVRGVGRADAVVVGRVQSATATGSDGNARTRFVVLAAIAGAAPKGEIEVAGESPPLRYAAGDTVVVLLQRPDGAAAGWRSAQVAGTGLPTDAAGPSEAVRLGLQKLWKATRDAPLGTDLSGQAPTDLAPTIAALVVLARAPERKLHTLAALDLAEFAHHPESFSPEARASIDGLLADPHTEAGLRAVLAVTVRTLAAGAAPTPGTNRVSG